MALLNKTKDRLKLVHYQVIQDVYDIFQSPSLVDTLLKMTFPSLYDYKALSKADQLINNAKTI
jgi:hypothetical protein